MHLPTRFGRTITQAEWVKELKRVSNIWLKERGRDCADFDWQGGYANFSVSQSNLEQSINPIVSTVCFKPYERELTLRGSDVTCFLDQVQECRCFAS